MAENDRVGRVKLRNVRLSFPHLFEPQEGMVDEDTGKKGADKYNAAFLFSKNTPDGKANFAAVKAAAEAVKTEKWGKNPPKLKPEKICLRDGDQEDWDGYEDCFYLTSSNTRQPVLIDRRKGPDGQWVRLLDSSGDPVPGALELLYAGCYVNAVVSLWAQDNKHGKRINASLEAVQFVKHGEAFGAKPVNPDDSFDDSDVPDEDDESGGGDDDGLI